MIHKWELGGELCFYFGVKSGRIEECWKDEKLEENTANKEKDCSERRQVIKIKLVKMW